MVVLTENRVENITPNQGEAVWRLRLREALDSARFEAFITLLILLNAVVLGAMTYSYGQGEKAEKLIATLLRIDIMIIVIFALEMILKIIANGRNFFRSGWNLFDLSIISLGMFGSSYPLTILRSLRVLRLFRLIKGVPSMRRVVESFLKSIPGLGAVFGVMVMVLFIFAVIGTGLFKTVSPPMFGDLQSSIYTLFTVLTLEGWPDVAREVMSEVPGAWVFFVLYISLNSFVALNLIIAVTIDSIQRDDMDDADNDRDLILAELKALRAELKRYNQG